MRTKNTRGATRGGYNCFGLKDVDFVISHAEAYRSSDLARVLCVKEQSDGKNPLVDVSFSNRCFCRLCNDGLIRLTMDHDLPTPLALVSPIGILEDRESPFLEKVYR